MDVKSRYWLVLEIKLPAFMEESLDVFWMGLKYCGSEIYSLEDNKILYKAYFQGDKSTRYIEKNIEEKLSEVFQNQIPEYSITTLENKDWVAQSRLGFKPLKISENFIVHPSWNIPEKTDEKSFFIQIDPQQAFGTGSHESTRLAVRLLEKYFHCSHKRCLDAGTGSGILLIVLSKLIEVYCEHLSDYNLFGIDTDNEIVDIARKNIKKNNCNVDINLISVPLELLTLRGFDLVVANILSEILSRNLIKLKKITNPHGIIIMSGIMIKEDIDFNRKLTDAGFNVLTRLTEGEWIAYVVSPGKTQIRRREF